MPLVVGAIDLEQALPPVPALGVEEVDPSAATAPAPAFKFGLTILLLDEKVQLGRFLVDGIVGRPLEMRIDDNDHLKGRQ